MSNVIPFPAFSTRALPNDLVTCPCCNGSGEAEATDLDFELMVLADETECSLCSGSCTVVRTVAEAYEGTFE